MYSINSPCVFTVLIYLTCSQCHCFVHSHCWSTFCGHSVKSPCVFTISIICVFTPLTHLVCLQCSFTLCVHSVDSPCVFTISLICVFTPLIELVFQRVLKELVGEKLPRLQAHFELHEVDLSLYTFNWFLTIFVDNVRPETFLRCWDVLLYEGSKVSPLLFVMNIDVCRY